MRGIDDLWIGTSEEDEPRLPFGFGAGAAFTLTLSASVVMSSLSVRPSVAAGLAVMAAIALLLGWFSTWPAALATAALGWLMLDGFFVDRYGSLSWHGMADAVRLGVLVASGLVAAVLRTVQLHSRRRRSANLRLDRELDELLGSVLPTHEGESCA